MSETSESDEKKKKLVAQLSAREAHTKFRLSLQAAGYKEEYPGMWVKRDENGKILATLQD